MKKFLVCILSFIMLISTASLVGCDGLGGVHTDHSYEISKVAPTCEERGYVIFKCECGDKYEDNYIDALGHDLSDWAETVAPTQTTKGEKQRTCKREGCNYSETEEIPALTNHTHAYTKKITSDKYLKSEATCTKKAYYYYSCDCGESGTSTFESGSVSDHVYVSGKCKWCNTPQQSAHTHAYNKKVESNTYLKSEATCKQKAVYCYSCACGESGTLTFESGSVSDHVYVSGKCKWCNTPETSAQPNPTHPNAVSKTTWEQTLGSVIFAPCTNGEFYVSPNSDTIFNEYITFEVDGDIICKKEFVNGVLDYEAYLDMSGNVPYLYYKNNGWVKEEYHEAEEDLTFISMTNVLAYSCANLYESFTFDETDCYYVGNVMLGGEEPSRVIIRFENGILKGYSIQQGNGLFKLSKVGEVSLTLPTVA